MFFARIFTLFLLLFFFNLHANTPAKKDVNIGVLSFVSKEDTAIAWSGIIRTLNTSIPEYNFCIKAMDYKELNYAMTKGELDFIFTNPEHYIALAVRHSVTRVATVVRSDQNGNVIKSFGGAIVALADRKDINSIHDIVGKKIAAVSKESLGGYLAQAGELYDIGIDVTKDRTVEFTDMPHDKVIMAVKNKKADVGFVRTSVLETMVKNGKIKLDEFKIINRKYYGNFPYIVSTKLYPEWPFASAAHTNPDLVKKVTITLFEIPEGSEVLKMPGFYSWTVPMVYEPLKMLMSKLKVHPFDIQHSFSLKEVVVRYSIELTLFLCTGLFIMILLMARSRMFRIRLEEKMVQLADEIEIRHEAEQKLKLIAGVFEHSSEGIVVTDSRNVIIEVNSAFERLTGYTKDEVLGKNPSILKSGKHKKEFYKKMYEVIHTQGFWQGELWNKNKKGDLYAELLSINTIKNENGFITNYVAIFNDITQNKEYQEKMAYLVNYDPLTGLANRRFLLTRLEHAIQVAKRTKKLIALIFVDLDNFKYVNDTLGHDAGDELLLQIVSRLNSIIRESDTLSRMGGDEFVILVENISYEEDIGALAQKIVDTISPSYTIHKTAVFTSASVGVSVFPNDGESMDVLMKKADMAMYQSKERGKNRFCFFSNDLENELKHRLFMLNQIRYAIENKELILHFQPQVDINQNKIVGIESLLRWSKPDIGIVMPLEFLKYIEDDSLMVQLSELVVSKAFLTLKLLQAKNIDVGCLSINIADRQFKDRQFVEKIKIAVEFFGIDPQKIKIELSESTVTNNVNDSIEKLKELRAFGIKVAIDSFGTGHVSIRHIKNFPVDELKIDRTFVKNIGNDQSDENMTTAIIAMSQALGIETVAVGVENSEQVEFLRAKGCHIMQGFYFWAPVDEQQIIKIVEAEN